MTASASIACIRRSFAPALAVCAALLVALACDSKSNPPAAGGGATAPAAPTPAGPGSPAGASVVPAIPPGTVLLAELPKAAALGDIIRSAKVGDRVVFAARVAGRADPFVAGRAMMIVSDPSLKPCNEREDDKCPTPADLCCETKETIMANTATVQIVGADGKAIPVALSGVGGLATLDHVVVEGVLVERGDKGGFVVNASKVTRQPAASAAKS